MLRHLELDRLQIRLQRVPHSSEARVGVCLLPLPLRWKQKRLGAISERDLVYWATMLLLNDAYELALRQDPAFALGVFIERRILDSTIVGFEL